MTKEKLRDMLETSLLMIIGSHQEVISSEDVDRLTKKQMEQICRWAMVMQYEASDNPCRARCAPKCLRKILPSDHYLQTWRLPKRGAA